MSVVADGDARGDRVVVPLARPLGISVVDVVYFEDHPIYDGPERVPGVRFASAIVRVDDPVRVVSAATRDAVMCIRGHCLAPTGLFTRTEEEWDRVSDMPCPFSSKEAPCTCHHGRVLSLRAAEQEPGYAVVKMLLF